MWLKGASHGRRWANQYFCNKKKRVARSLAEALEREKKKGNENQGETVYKTITTTIALTQFPLFR